MCPRYRCRRRKRVWADQLIAYSGVTTVQATDLLADFRGTAGSATVGLAVMAINCTQNGAVGAGPGAEGTSWHPGLSVGSVNAAVAGVATPVGVSCGDWMGGCPVLPRPGCRRRVVPPSLSAATR